MIKLRLQGTLAHLVRDAATTSRGDRTLIGQAEPQDVVVDEVLELDAGTVAQALRLVAPQVPGFAEALMIGRWRITVDGSPARDVRELDLRLPDRAYVSVAPELSGAGPALAIPTWVSWVLTGASLLYAVTQIPSILDTNHLEDSASRRTLFSGPINTAAQGGAVPLIYGRCRVGSTVVSGGVSPDRPTGGDHSSPSAIGLGGQPASGSPQKLPPEDRFDPFQDPDPEAGEASRERTSLRVVDLLGEGEIEGLAEDGLKSVYLDGVAVEDADGERTVEGVAAQVLRGLAHGSAGQKALAGYDVTATNLGHDSAEVEHGDPEEQEIPRGYDAARVTLRWPSLLSYDEDGREVAAEVKLQIRSRPAGAGAWTTVLAQTVRDLSLGPRELAWRVERPESVGDSGRWEIEVSRQTAAPADTRTVDAFHWVGTAGLRDVKQTYPRSVVVGLVIDAAKAEVNPTRREYEVKGRKVLTPPNSVWNPDAKTATSAATYGAGIWDGKMVRRWTDNPAWIVYDLLTDRRAGLGGVPGMADAVGAARADFLEMSRWCDELVPAPDSEAAMEPRWRFNGVIQRREEARKVVDWVLSSCRAGLAWSAGAAAVAVDNERDVAAAVGNANVIDGEFEYQGVRWQDRYSAVAVTWQDPDDAYRSTIELVVSDELVERHGYRQRDVAAMGCTSRGQAHRVGLLVLSEQETESETVRFRMALEGMHLRPGDRIRVADERRFEARAAWRLAGVDASVAGRETLTLDAPAPRLAAGGRIVWGENRSAAVSSRGEASFEGWLGGGAVVPANIYWASANLDLPAVFGGVRLERLRLIRTSGAGTRIHLWASGELPAEWEDHPRAVTFRAGSTSVTVGGPTAPGSVRPDSTEPYDWAPSAAEQTALRAWADGYLDNGSNAGHIELRIPRSVASSVELLTNDVPTGLTPGDLVLNAAGAIDWIVTRLEERDPVEVAVEARRYNAAKYPAVEQRRMLAPPVADPLASILAPTAVTAVEKTYVDRGVVRSLLEIAVEGGDDPRIAQVEYQIQRPLRPATAAEITAGNWTVLPRGKWEPLQTTSARSLIERNAARGGYRLRARFLARRRRRSEWTLSAPFVVDGQRIAPVAGLVVTKHGYRFGDRVVRGLRAGWTDDGSDFEVRLRWRITEASFGPAPDLSAWTTGIWGNRLIYPGEVGATYEVQAQRGDPATGETQHDPEWSEAVEIELSGDLDPPADPANLTVIGIQGGYEASCDDPREIPLTGTPAEIEAARSADVDAWSWFHVEEDADGNFPANPPAGSYVQRTASPQCVFVGFESAKRVKVWVRAIDIEVNGDNASNWVSVIVETKRGGTSIGRHCESCTFTATALEWRLTWTLPETDVPEFWQVQFAWPNGVEPDIITWGSAAYVVGTATTRALDTSLLPTSLVGQRVLARIAPATKSGSGYVVGGHEYIEALVTTPGTGLVTPVLSPASSGDGLVGLGWSVVSGTVTYRIQRATGTGVNRGAWSDLATVAAPLTTYRDNTAVNSTAYSYRVRAESASQQSSYSNIVTATPMAGQVPTTPPSAPRNQDLTADGESAADFDWDSPSSWGTGSSSSRLYRFELHQGSTLVTSGTTTSTSRRFTGLTAETAYRAQVRAETADGNSAYVSDTATTDAATPVGRWGAYVGFFGWSRGIQPPSDYVIPIPDIAAFETDGSIGGWNTRHGWTPTQGVWAGGGQLGVCGVHSVNLNGTVTVIQTFQAFLTNANRMRNTVTNAYFNTNLSLLHDLGTDLDDYWSADLDFVAPVSWGTVTSHPSLPAGARSLGFVVWRRNGATDGSGTQHLIALTSTNGWGAERSRTVS